MIIDREIQPHLIRLSKQYPVVSIMGPRQSGKTTLVRHVFHEKPYVNLENPSTRELAESDPNGFLNQYPNGAILDEVQRFPALLSYIQVIVDEKKINGFFILTGSHQLALHEAVSQSLAGRVALLTLLPLSISELMKADVAMKFTTDDFLFHGFYPRVYAHNLNPVEAYANYYQTYIERDVRQLINLKDLTLFQQFIRLCAGRAGQILNINSLCNDLGVTHNTVKHWLSILEASFIIFRLPPYYENFGKRIIKSSKLYFYDVGLASFLLGIENINQLSRDPLRGNLFENMVVIEMLKWRFNQARLSQLFYFRDSYGREIDVIHKAGNKLIPVEIKSSQTFNKQFFKNINYFRSLASDKCEQGYVVYSGYDSILNSENALINYRSIENIFDKET